MTVLDSIPKYLRCNLCGSTGFTLFLKSSINTSHNSTIYSTTSQAISGEDLISCSLCGLIFVYPMPERKKLISQYKATVEEKYLKEVRARSVTFRKILKHIQMILQNDSTIVVNKRRVKFMDKPLKLLDVGAGAGFLVKEAQIAGFDAYGIEPNKFLASWGQKHLGARILNGSFEEMGMNRSYDLVTFVDVLEHMTDPKAALEKTHKLLKKGGLVVINYPDIKSSLAKIFGKNWWFIVSGHLYYFDRQTIKKMLKVVGFEIISDKKHFQTFSLAYLIRQIGRYDKHMAEKLYEFCLKLKLDKVFITYWAGQRMVVAKKHR